MAVVLASRQFADWRELRFEPFASPLVRKSLAQLASRMRDTFWQPSAASARPGGRLSHPPGRVNRPVWRVRSRPRLSRRPLWWTSFPGEGTSPR